MVQPGQNGQAAINESALKAALIEGIRNAAGIAFSMAADGNLIADIDGGANALPLIDATAPLVVSRSVNRSEQSVTLTFDSPLDSSAVPAGSAFSVTTPVGSPSGAYLPTINSVSEVQVSGNGVLLRLASGFEDGSVNISYTPPGDGTALRDTAGNRALGLSSALAADGYLRGAQVWVDVAGNGSYVDSGVVTGPNGEFFLPPQYASKSFEVRGGVNTDTGVVNTVNLRAPAGFTTVNPLTTLVQAVTAKDTGLLAGTNAAARANAASEVVASALGLPSSIDLNGYDPLALLSSGSKSADALAAQKAAASVATLLALSSVNGATSGTKAIDSLAGQLTAASVSGAPLSLNDPSVLSSALGTSGAGSTVPTSVLDALAAINAATDFGKLSQAQAIALDQTPPAAPTWPSAQGLSRQTLPVLRVSVDAKSLVGTAAAVGDKLELLLGEAASNALSFNRVVGTLQLTAEDIGRGYAEIAPKQSLPHGVHQLAARLSDAAGNVSRSSGPYALTVDLMPPPAPLLAPVAGDDLVGLAELTSLSLTGTAEADSRIQVGFLGVKDEVRADSTGSWTYALSKARQDALAPESSVDIEINAVDAAGNASATIQRNIRIDVTAPLPEATISQVIDNVVGTGSTSSPTGPIQPGATTDDQTLSLSGT